MFQKRLNVETLEFVRLENGCYCENGDNCETWLKTRTNSIMKMGDKT